MTENQYITDQDEVKKILGNQKIKVLKEEDQYLTYSETSDEGYDYYICKIKKSGGKNKARRPPPGTSTNKYEPVPQMG